MLGWCQSLRDLGRGQSQSTPAILSPYGAFGGLRGMCGIYRTETQDHRDLRADGGHQMPPLGHIPSSLFIVAPFYPLRQAWLARRNDKVLKDQETEQGSKPDRSPRVLSLDTGYGIDSAFLSAPAQCFAISRRVFVSSLSLCLPFSAM